MNANREPRSLAELPSLMAGRFGTKLALRVEGREQTYQELADSASAVAAALQRDGIGPGTRVALFGRDGLSSVAVLFGAAQAKAVSVPINWRLTPDETAHVLRDSGAKLVFVEPDFMPLIEAASSGLSSPPRVVSLAAAAGAAPGFEEWVGSASGPVDLGPSGDEDVVTQLYTSGTTGLAKGVLLPNRTFFAIARELAARNDPWITLDDRDVTLLPVPTFHVAGFWWLVRGLAGGSTHIIVPTFDPQRILELIPRYRVTKTGMVPVMMFVLLADPACESTDFSSLRTILYGGSPMSSALLERARDVFRCDFCQMYGLTETGNLAVTMRPEHHWTGPEERMLAAGTAMPGVQIRIVKSDGSLAKVREPGEIVIRSPAQMVGYWNLPEATEATLVDGWIKTGDCGYLDEDGFLYVCERMKDIIISGGEHVYSAEIERVLRTHPGVLDVAVIGIPDEYWGESVLAVVHPRSPESVSSRELTALARQKLAEFKVPKRIEFVAALPRNSTGKVLKHVLREPYWGDRQRKIN
jgi:long-chain acyl-CoA synthetase